MGIRTQAEGTAGAPLRAVRQGGGTPEPFARVVERNHCPLTIRPFPAW